MSEKLATLKKDGNISTMTLDDGKANVFSAQMSRDVNECLDEVATEEGCLIMLTFWQSNGILEHNF